MCPVEKKNCFNCSDFYGYQNFGPQKANIFYTSFYIFFFLNNILIYVVLIEGQKKMSYGVFWGKGAGGKQLLQFLDQLKNHLILFITYTY